MDIYVHMKGSHIGEFNIYQAPVIGFAVRKLSIAGELGAHWVKQEIQFDSKVEFQVSQSWRLSGYWWLVRSKPQTSRMKMALLKRQQGFIRKHDHTWIRALGFDTFYEYFISLLWTISPSHTWGKSWAKCLVATQFAQPSLLVCGEILVGNFSRKARK